MTFAQFQKRATKGRMKSLSPERRKEIARKAAVTRWGKKVAPTAPVEVIAKVEA